MIWHPLVWAFWVLTATGGVLYGLAAVRALDIAANWRPGQADRDQLRRERRAEAACLLGQWSLGCLSMAALVGVVGIALVWHRLIPGAMCGTGVLQAMGHPGYRALILWGIALALLFVWQVVVQLDLAHPAADLTEAAARVLTAAAPFLILAAGFSWQALMRVGSAEPVSCCAAIYDRVLEPSSPSLLSQTGGAILLWISLAGGVALLSLALWMRRHPDHRAGGLLLLAAAGWTVAGTMAVKHLWSAYYYQVLSHPCPWCLFLPDYHGAGFFIFGCLSVTALESLAVWAAAVVGRRHPLLSAAAHQRIHRATGRIVAATVGFTLLTAGVAVAWRLNTGVWIHGAI